MLNAKARSMFSPFYFNMLKHFPLTSRLKIEFFRKHRRFLNLVAPATYNEKIAWRKLYDRDPRLPLWSDKIEVKKIVSRIIGKEFVLPDLWVGEDSEEIPLKELSRPYVIKTSNGSGTNIFVKEDDDVSNGYIIKKLKSYLKVQLANRTDEWPYALITPQILVEPMLLDAENFFPVDYKFHVFNGKVIYIQVDVGRFKDHRRSFYDLDWQKQPFSVRYPLIGGDYPQPPNLEEMIQIAQKLGKEFHYVRIDLYDIMDRVIFSEATFFPGAGYLRFKPQEMDYEWGGLWELPNITDLTKCF